MKVYVGQTRSTDLIQQLSEQDIGECTVREEYPPRRSPWFLDNGAYRDWKAGEKINIKAFYDVVLSLIGNPNKPDFIIAPDIVAGGLTSLALSREHVSSLRYLAPVYLAVQDGMIPENVLPYLSLFQGLFVGGSTQWKERSGKTWVAFAHQHGLPCHIGRVGTPRKVWWPKSIGADSIDSCFPLFTRGNMKRFLFALHHENPQWELF